MHIFITSDGITLIANKISVTCVFLVQLQS